MDHTLKNMTDRHYSQYDMEAVKILDAFLPDRLFDAHAHLSHIDLPDRSKTSIREYLEEMEPLIGKRELKGNYIIHPLTPLKSPRISEESTHYLKEQLTLHPGNAGEILVLPNDSEEEIEKQLIHPCIKGLKCYHIFADRKDTFYAGIEEYLPQTAWEVANARGLCITLHMVRPHALADEGNRAYIKMMAKRYPNAKLILAHCARAFASWTAIESVSELVPYENVFFDFAAVCESPAMIQILKKVGVKRCMFGTDWPCSMSAGKCISIGDTFYWLNEKELRSFTSKTDLHTWLVGTETLMAQRQACLLTDLKERDIEDLFYNTAASLFL